LGAPTKTKTLTKKPPVRGAEGVGTGGLAIATYLVTSKTMIFFLHI
jgi:hypothetical protein